MPCPAIILSSRLFICNTAVAYCYLYPVAACNTCLDTREAGPELGKLSELQFAVGKVCGMLCESIFGRLSKIQGTDRIWQTCELMLC